METGQIKCANWYLTAVAVALVLGIHAHSHAADQNTDLIDYGGTIVAANDLQPDAEAAAVRGGHVVAVGYRDEVTKLKPPNTKVIDLAGKAMVPGLIDAHGRVFAAGMQGPSASLLPLPMAKVPTSHRCTAC
jgi:predicted amidohydrolase YtcJ